MPISASTSRAAGSPLWASSVTIPPVISRPAASRLPSADSGRSSATRRPSRPIALPETSVSKQPRPGQALGHSAPWMSSTECPISRAEPASRPGTRARRDTGRVPIPVPSETITTWRAPVARAAPGTPPARDALPSLSTTTGRPSRSLIRSRKRHVLERQVVAPARHARLPLDERRDPEAHGLDVRGRRAHLLDRVQEDVERLLAVRSPPHPVHAVMHHQVLVDDTAEQLRAARVDPDHPPWWHGRVDIQRGVNERTPALRTARSTTSTAPASDGLRALAISTRSSAGCRAAAATSRRGRRASKRQITPGRVAKWIALAIAGWLLLSLALFLISAATQPGVSPRRRARALLRRQPAHRQHDPRAGLRPAHGRVDRRERSGPGPLRHDHARPRLARQRAQALDPARRRGRGPGPRHQQDQRRLRAGRPRADDRDRRVLPRQRARDQPPGRGRLRGLPRVHRLAGRHHRRVEVAHLLSPVRQLLEGPPLQEGRERAGRHAARSASRACARTRAPRPRTTATAPPASRRSCARSGTRSSRRARSSGCRG